MGGGSGSDMNVVSPSRSWWGLSVERERAGWGFGYG